MFQRKESKLDILLTYYLPFEIVKNIILPYLIGDLYLVLSICYETKEEEDQRLLYDVVCWSLIGNNCYHKFTTITEEEEIYDLNPFIVLVYKETLILVRLNQYRLEKINLMTGDTILIHDFNNDDLESIPSIFYAKIWNQHLFVHVINPDILFFISLETNAINEKCIKQKKIWYFFHIDETQNCLVQWSKNGHVTFFSTLCNYMKEQGKKRHIVSTIAAPCPDGVPTFLVSNHVILEISNEQISCFTILDQTNTKLQNWLESVENFFYEIQPKRYHAEGPNTYIPPTYPQFVFKKGGELDPKNHGKSGFWFIGVECESKDRETLVFFDIDLSNYKSEKYFIFQSHEMNWSSDEFFRISEDLFLLLNSGSIHIWSCSMQCYLLSLTITNRIFSLMNLTKYLFFFPSLNN